MLRRFNLTEDNQPSSKNFLVTIESGVSQYALDTGCPVFWAIVNQSNIIEAESRFLGPFVHIPSAGEAASGVYSIRDFAGVNPNEEYEENSLMVFYGKLIMTQGLEYNEVNVSDVFDGISFKFDSSYVDPLPATDEEIIISFRRSVTTDSGVRSVSVIDGGLYPDNPTGIIVELTGFTPGDIVQLYTIYR